MRAASSNWLDGLAISLSAACAVHCLVLPVLLALLPALSEWLDLPESVHLRLLLCALPVSLFVLGSASLRDRDGRTALLIGLGGLTLMGSALLAPSEGAETALTLAGASLLALAHIRNWLRRVACPAD